MRLVARRPRAQYRGDEGEHQPREDAPGAPGRDALGALGRLRGLRARLIEALLQLLPRQAGLLGALLRLAFGSGP